MQVIEFENDVLPPTFPNFVSITSSLYCLPILPILSLKAIYSEMHSNFQKITYFVVDQNIVILLASIIETFFCVVVRGFILVRQALCCLSMLPASLIDT
jgi:hypothetical protein